MFSVAIIVHDPMQYPGYGKQGHRTIGNLYNTLMHLAGNLDAAIQRGPLPELIG